MYQPEDSIYKRQLRRGFDSLRFEEPLENDFRQGFLHGRIPGIRMALGLGLVLVAVLALLDWRLLPQAYWQQSLLIWVGCMLPLMGLALIATYIESIWRHLAIILSVCAFAVALLALGTGTLVVQLNLNLPFVGLVVVTMYAYLLLGFRLYQALLVTVPLFVIYFGIAAFSGHDATEFAYKGVLLIFANIVGVMGCYRLEHSARTIFLETQIMNLLVGSDALTGIPNRRIFNTHLQSVWRQTQRESRSLAIALIDVDHFKNFNDRYGHQAGDTCLRRIAHTLTQTARRPLDLTARFGGEEFVMLLFDPQSDHVEALAARIRDQIALLDIPHETSEVSSRITVSIGIAVAGPNCQRSAEGILQVADEALYEAKDTGRDRFVIRQANEDSGETGVFRGPWREPGTG